MVSSDFAVYVSKTNGELISDFEVTEILVKDDELKISYLVLDPEDYNKIKKDDSFEIGLRIYEHYDKNQDDIYIEGTYKVTNTEMLLTSNITKDLTRTIYLKKVSKETLNG
mgnify:CR=1 FL=1